MKAISISRYGQILKMSQVKMPEKLLSNQILIKMNSAPINPSDIYFSKGVYGVRKPLPTIIGFEGSGTIVEKGSNVSQHYLNKKAAFWISENVNSGSWSEYAVTDINSCIILDQTADLAQCACPFVNPITAVGFLDIVQQGKHKCVILNAANSAVGRMSIQLFNKQGIKTIAIIRKDEQIKGLLELGSNFVLNQSKETFLEELKEIANKNEASCFFDAVGGDVAGNIFCSLPDHSSMYSYGVFSLKTIDKIDPAHLVFRQKKIQGFWLTKWLEKKSQSDQEMIKEYVKLNLGSIFATRIEKIFKLEDVNKAIIYYMTNSSQGKVLLQP